ncbi:ethionine resistance protein [Coemansia erecta]|uniref:Ethionine resistance protein n=1 Tax=Coemansia asiatica TaxID=1052880 RepID=A0A9W8CL57_9FUNG|nr:ethionine resistance protein [Coemansia asiatica]KAJ2855307.1 ethionine resistance protein [Coemansia erecta]KAJ2886372.1 ethionine resistance protein [Coemansia asiatica]
MPHNHISESNDETQPLQGSSTTVVENTSDRSRVTSELKWLSSASLPLIGTYYLHYMFGFFNLISLGTWGGKALGAYALANLTCAILAFAPTVGIASALDTLCAASFAHFGGGRQVGLHLQRGLLAITLLYAAIFAIIQCLLPTIYKALGQDQQLAEPATAYLRVVSLGLWPWMAFECLKRYVQANTQMRLPTMVLAVVVPIHLFNHWFFAWRQPGQSFIVVAWITVASYWAMFAGLVVCIVYLDALRPAWHVYGVKALFSSGFYSLAVPAMIEACGEYMAFELMTLLATYLGPTSLAAQAIAFNSMSMTFQFPHAVGGAAAVRIGRLLGRGNAYRAAFASRVLIAGGLLYSIIGTIFFMTYGARWVAIYTKDEEVLAVARKLIYFVALLEWTDATRGIVPGILRGMGKQRRAAIINVSSYYFVVLPVASLTIYGFGMGIFGLWSAFSLGMVLLSSWYIATTISTDWIKEAELCIDRIA